MKGYYGNPEATAKAVNTKGWYHSGDIAVMVLEGNISIVGRKKENKMDREIILKKLLQMLQKQTEGKNIKLASIGYDSNLAQIGFDSLDFSEIIVNVEEEFECVIRMDDMLKLRTMNDFADFIIKETEG